ncbi:hypothetical protein [Actinophytocola sp.]|uniref:hypothetical protein n=1 Tax=Actinophytocola sp. TaxID=1872138 RepID=UPI00389A8847
MRTVGVLTGAGVAFGVFVLAVTASDRYEESTTTLFSGTVGGLYLVAGLVASLRRPDNPVGLVMVLVGIGWFAEDLQISASPPVHTVGMLLRSASAGFVVQLLLIFPDGRLRSAADRALVAAGYGATFILVPLSALFIASEVPNLLLVLAAGWPTPAVDLVQISLGAAVVSTLLRRWLTASPPARRVIAPVYVAGLVGGGPRPR